MKYFNHIFPLTGCSAVLFITSTFLNVTTPMCNASKIQREPLTIKELYELVDVPPIAPDKATDGDYKFLYEQVHNALLLGDQDLNTIKRKAGYKTTDQISTKLQWKHMLNAVATMYNQPLRLLKYFKYRAIPAEKTNYESFLNDLSDVPCGSQPHVKELIKHNANLESEKERIDMFIKFAKECITVVDPMENYLYLLGYSTVDYSNPNIVKSLVTKLIESNFALQKRVITHECSDVLRYGIELFASHPKRLSAEAFTSLQNKIAKLYGTRLETLPNLLIGVAMNPQKDEEKLKNLYKKLVDFGVYNEKPITASSMSQDLLDAVKDVANAKDFETAKTALEKDKKVWERLIVRHNNSSKFSKEDTNTFNYLARVNLASLREEVSKLTAEELTIGETLFYYQYRKPYANTEKYQECLVTLIFAFDEKMVVVREEIDKTWPTIKETHIKYGNFCMLYSQIWEQISKKPFHGINVNIGTEDFEGFVKTVAGHDPNLKSVAMLLLNWYYPGALHARRTTSETTKGR